MNEDNSTLPETLDDDTMHSAIKLHLYEFYGKFDEHARPNFRYCQPGTPEYHYSFQDGLWHKEYED